MSERVPSAAEQDGPTVKTSKAEFMEMVHRLRRDSDSELDTIELCGELYLMVPNAEGDGYKTVKVLRKNEELGR